MTTPLPPLVDPVFPDDTLANVRNVLGVAATAALADDSVTWIRCGAGLALLLGMVDDALAFELEHRRQWASGADAEVTP